MYIYSAYPYNSVARHSYPKHTLGKTALIFIRTARVVIRLVIRSIKIRLKRLIELLLHFRQPLRLLFLCRRDSPGCAEKRVHSLLRSESVDFWSIRNQY